MDIRRKKRDLATIHLAEFSLLDASFCLAALSCSTTATPMLQTESMKRTIPLIVFALVLSTFATTQENSSAADSKPSNNVTSLNAGLGPCRVEFTVTDANAKPIYDAKIITTIRYGAFGVKRTEVEVGTNSEGKALLTGLPSLPKRSFTFGVSKGELSTTYPYNSLAGCNQKAMIVLK